MGPGVHNDIALPPLGSANIVTGKAVFKQKSGKMVIGHLLLIMAAQDLLQLGSRLGRSPQDGQGRGESLSGLDVGWIAFECDPVRCDGRCWVAALAGASRAGNVDSCTGDELRQIVAQGLREGHFDGTLLGEMSSSPVYLSQLTQGDPELVMQRSGLRLQV